MTLSLNNFFFLGIAFLPACSAGTLIPLERAVQAAQPKRFSLKIEGYCPKAATGTVFRYRELFATNLSYAIEKGSLINDTDTDGVPDAHETESAFAMDSNNDGYSDLLVSLTGMDLSAQLKLPPADTAGTDSDADGLWDADERILGTNELSFDSDGDGIPDGLEARFKADPLDDADEWLRAGGDLYSNLEKIKMGLPLRETAPEEVVKNLAVKYALLSQMPSEPSCYDFMVSNIPLAPIRGSNQMRLSFVEENATGERRLATRSLAVASQTLENAVIVYRYQEHEE